MRLAVLMLLLALPACARAAAPPARIVVADLTGARVAPLGPGPGKATVLVYITNDCPIANACAPEIERIYQAYSAKQVRMYLVYVDASLTAVAARAHHNAFGYTCPAVLDPRHRLVKAGRARVTPEAAIFGGDGSLLYHGRIDDRAVAFGQVRAQPIRKDLREALDALLLGKPIKPPKAKAVGCSIANLGHG